MLIVALIIPFLIIGVIFLSYWVPKKIGYPRLGKYFASLLAIIIVATLCFVIFHDKLFSKAEARKLLKEQGVMLTDDFRIEENESMFGPGDYYHTFKLSISNKDKVRIINEIKNSPNFNKDGQSAADFDEGNADDIKRINNFETEKQFGRSLFQQRKGYSPILRKITIDKGTNSLIFEDIDF